VAFEITSTQRRSASRYASTRETYRWGWGAQAQPKMAGSMVGTNDARNQELVIFAMIVMSSAPRIPTRWLPFVTRYRIMCLAPNADFRRLLENVVEPSLAA
jgi:hypothetical protein